MKTSDKIDAAIDMVKDLANINMIRDLGPVAHKLEKLLFEIRGDVENLEYHLSRQQ